jgi:glycosyltransferase involved in cell wall biosynthesis
MVRAPSVDDLRQVIMLRKLIKHSDVVHLHSSKAGALGRIALHSLGRSAPPSAFTPHNWSWRVGGAMGGAYRALEWILASASDTIVCVAEGELDDGQRLLGERVRKMSLIPNGVDISVYSPEGPRAARSPEPLLVLVGRLCEAKAQDIAISALAQMHDQNVRLRLVGDGPDEGQLRDLARELNVVGRVEWEGHTDPRPHLRAADVVVIPSRWDAAPLALAEAMACGAAVVCSDAVGSADTLGAGGVIVPAGDVEALAGSLDALLDERDRRQELKRSARRQALKLPSLNDSCVAHVRLWHDLLDDAIS